MASRQLRVYIVGDADSASKAAGQVEKRFGAMGGKLEGIGSKVAKAFKTVAKTTAAAVITTLGVAVKTGWDRLKTLERADTMFRQMGLTAQQSGKLMDGVSDVVTGTAFSLDEAATAAAAFVSANVPLDDVKRRLELAADAAAYGGAPFAEVASIFNDVQLNTKLSARELRMLQQRGIPALGVLASGLGTTEAEVRKLASSGKISSQQFVDAWEKGAKGFGDANIVMAGAAQSMGDTVEGSLGNLKTALARFGAELLTKSGVWGAAPTVIQGVTDALNYLRDQTGPAIDAVRAHLERMDFGRLWDTAQKAWPIVLRLGESLWELRGILQGGTILAFGLLVEGLNLALTVLQPVSVVVEKLTKFLDDHSATVGIAVAAWIGWRRVAPVVSDVFGKVKNLGGSIKHFWDTVSGISTERGVSKFKVGVEAMGGGLKILSAAVIPAAVIAVGAVADSWRKAGEQARAAAKEMKDSAEDSLAGLQGLVNQAGSVIDEAKANLRSEGFRDDWLGRAYDGIGSTIQGLGSAVGLMDDKIAKNRKNVDEFTKTQEEAKEKLDALKSAYRKVGEVWTGLENHALNRTKLNEYGEAVDKWRIKLGLTTDEAIRLDREGKLIQTLTDARDAALNGTPATDDFTKAIEDLSDETADATDRLKAWKDAIDAALGGQKNVTDSTISYKDQMKRLQDQMKDSNGTFDMNTEAGRKNLAGLSDLIGKSIDLAGAVGEQTGSTEDAHKALVGYREQIIKQLESSGKSRKEAEKLVNSFGFSADALNDVAIEATNARKGIEKIPGQKSIHITTHWDEIKTVTIREQKLQDWADYGKYYARRHTGGTFRAPTPGGEGLALLRDGERVYTPTQGPSGVSSVSTSSTTIVNVHVAGTVTSERDLTDAVIDSITRKQKRSTVPILAGVS